MGRLCPAGSRLCGGRGRLLVCQLQTTCTQSQAPPLAGAPPTPGSHLSEPATPCQHQIPNIPGHAPAGTALGKPGCLRDEVRRHTAHEPFLPNQVLAATLTQSPRASRCVHGNAQHVSKLWVSVRASAEPGRRGVGWGGVLGVRLPRSQVNAFGDAPNCTRPLLPRTPRRT